MHELNSSVKDKIRKLLALSTSSNPNEAAAALAKAQQLLLEHNLSMSQIETGPTSKPGDDFIKSTVDIGRSVWRKTLAYTIAKANLCHALSVVGKPFLHIIGKEENIEAVVYMYMHIAGQLELMASLAYRLSGSELSSITWRDAFYMGAVRSIHERLEEEERAQSGQTKALIVRNDDAIKNAMQRFFNTSRIKSGGVKYVRSSDGYAHGREAGSRVSFRREIRP